MILGPLQRLDGALVLEPYGKIFTFSSPQFLYIYI